VVLTVPPNLPGLQLSGTNNTALSVRVSDSSTSNPIANASVTINAVALPYNAANQDFESQITLPPGGAVDLEVIVGGSRYSATGNQFALPPTVAIPQPNAVWSNQSSYNLSWSGAAAGTNIFTGVLVIDAVGNAVWPTSGGLLTAPAGSTTLTIPSGALGSGSRTVLIGNVLATPMSSAASGSGLALANMAASPINVINGPAGTGAALQGLSIGSAGTALLAGSTRQLTATGIFSGGSVASQDLSSQVSWTSSDPSRVSVSATGLLSPISAGPVTITASLGGFHASTGANLCQPLRHHQAGADHRRDPVDAQPRLQRAAYLWRHLVVVERQARVPCLFRTRQRTL